MKAKFVCRTCEKPCILKSKECDGKYYPIICPYGDVTIKAKWERVVE